MLNLWLRSLKKYNATNKSISGTVLRNRYIDSNYPRKVLEMSD